MGEEKIKHTSEWRPISELRHVQSDISLLGYNKEFIEEHGLNETKSFHWGSMSTGVMCYFEPLEVRANGDEILWRYNENHAHMDVPEQFETQLGIFNNHNHGEFSSWLGRDGYDGCSEEQKEINRLLGRDDYFIEGNYCDMFDCGKYSFAISNEMHMGLGMFKIIRIDKNLEAVTMYDNYKGDEYTRLEYAGRFHNSEGYVVITSGSKELERKEDKREYQKITFLFQIDRKGNCRISKEWDFSISYANSMAAVGDYVYFGQNKMITRLDVKTGEIRYFTDKTDEELAALVSVL